MKQKHYTSIVYFIAITIVITIAIQLYWNIQNYNSNKQRLVNEVQISLDNGVENYFADLAKTDFFAFIEESTDTLVAPSDPDQFFDHFTNDSTFFNIKKDSLWVSTDIKGFTQLLDSGKAITAMKPDHISSMSVFRGKKATDSIEGLIGLTNKIIVSFTRDSLDFKKLDARFKQELKRKDISISYALKQLVGDSIIGIYENIKNLDFPLTTFSKSTYLHGNQKLQLQFSNPTLTILKRSLTGIILSFLLSICIVICLLYLLHVIHKQKELAEIKNDLISNITHEFKTPIATVATAIEGIKNFNKTNDKVKTDNYLNISEQQLKKLHLMVEKLLETATLDSDKLIINKENLDLVILIESVVEKHQMLSSKKRILFKTNINSLFAEVDSFHFENVLANLIDNALKYGGDTVEVHMNSLLNSIEVTVADNGGKIDKNQREKIFDKFYRIPTGNRHDVKGFGIGLFYAKKIINKHDGDLILIPDNQHTIFKITL